VPDSLVSISGHQNRGYLEICPSQSWITSLGVRMSIWG
jgi:hypothetical protein